MLELRRFLDEIQKCLLLGQGQSVAFGRFVLVGGFYSRQDTIRGIHTDVLIVHRHRKDLMENILNGFQRVQRHLAVADDAIVVAADIRLANVLELHHADLIPDEPIVHIDVIGEGMLFQAHLVLTPQFKQVIQGQAALRDADALCQVALYLLFLFAQPLQGCIIDGMAFSVFRSPTVHIQPVALAVDLAILQNTAFIIFTSLHINSPFHSQNVEKEPYAMSIPWCKTPCNIKRSIFTPHQIENALSRYSSSLRRLISRLVSFQRTNLHSSLSVIDRSLLTPIPEYAAASSKVRLLFFQIGTSFTCTSTSTSL